MTYRRGDEVLVRFGMLHSGASSVNVWQPLKSDYIVTRRRQLLLHIQATHQFSLAEAARFRRFSK
jgi:hypothetical protein